MEESVDLHEEAGKEKKKQTLAYLSPAEEAASKDELEIEKFCRSRNKKNQYKTKSNLNAWKQF